MIKGSGRLRGAPVRALNRQRGEVVIRRDQRHAEAVRDGRDQQVDVAQLLAAPGGVRPELRRLLPVGVGECFPLK